MEIKCKEATVIIGGGIIREPNSLFEKDEERFVTIPCGFLKDAFLAPPRTLTEEELAELRNAFGEME